MKRIYLDNNASTFVDPKVADVIFHVLSQYPGNPSSPHHYGRESRSLLSQSRDLIAQHLKVKPKEIIFTSGGTEGANILLQGLEKLLVNGHMITSNLEHACIYSNIMQLQKKGIESTIISPGMYGAVTTEQILQAIKPNTKLIVLMAANNETGVKTDINSIAEIAEKRGITFIVDAVALFGKESFSIPSGVSAMIFSGHKFHAPKGCGFIYLKSTLKLHPLIIGGEQEHNRRAGTENLADIAGMAEGVKLLQNSLPEATEKMFQLRQRFEEKLIESLGEDVLFNGEGERVCNTVNVAFKGVDGETLLAAMDMEGIAASHGSACASGALEPSRILLNMGMPLERARRSMRFSLSRFNTEEEIDYTVETIICLVKKLKSKIY